MQKVDPAKRVRASKIGLVGACPQNNLVSFEKESIEATPPFHTQQLLFSLRAIPQCQLPGAQK